MKRHLATAAAVSVLGLPFAVLSLAPAADAVTNPAQNPHPITVKGDDGNTYTDGADTLPGFDDEACTYIPGAWFDFDNNRVHYADGQSIPWTEWDRATGYSEWKAKHDKPTATASAKPSSKPSASASSNPSSKPTSKPTSKPASGGGAGTGTKKSAGSGTSPTSAATTVASAGASASVSAAPTDGAQTQAPAATTTSTGAAAPTTDPSASTDQTAAQSGGQTAGQTDAQITEVAADTSGSSLSGFAIIGGLVALAVLLLGGNAVYRRSRKESAQ